MQKHPRQMRLRQFAPPILVGVLLLAALLLPIVPGAGYFLGFVAGVYAFGAMAAAIFSASKNGWQLLPLLPISFAILHLGYGSGFLIGLLKFWNRWGAAEGQLQQQPAIRDGSV
jgi:hypothetical protein